MEPILHIQGDTSSPLTPLILIHAISGFALPYLALGPLDGDDLSSGRPVYGVSSPLLGSSSLGKGSPLPTTLSALASQYVALLRREFPNGPYLLGGWSMGGMIAIEMAAILKRQGEEVLHVIMIDSLNPRLYPKFLDREEHEKVARITYNAIARRLGASLLPIHIQDDDDVVSEESSSAENSDDECAEMCFEEMLPRMKKHIHWGLSVVSNSSNFSHDLFDIVHSTPVTLIKCTAMGHIAPEIRDGRRKFIRRMNHDMKLGWPTDKFGRFHTIRFGATHDSCFDTGFVDELTRLMRGLLDGVQG